MKFWPLTLHVELHFDSIGVEPNPWYLPFLWLRHPWETLPAECDPEFNSTNHFILRCGVLGVHFCAAIHWYGEQAVITREELTP